MRVQVVQESMFGNTLAVANAIAEGLREQGCTVQVDPADPHTPVRPRDLLVVLGPTHAFGMSRPSTRADAVRQGADGSPRAGVREWLETLPAADRDSPAVACADTRATTVLPGSAAKAAHRRLQRLGYVPAAAPMSFRVRGYGPLHDGELARARAWGRSLAERSTVSPGRGDARPAGHGRPVGRRGEGPPGRDVRRAPERWPR